MLRIVSEVPAPAAIASVDPWIPLAVRWGLPLRDSPLYIFIRDPDQGYVELKVHPESGALVGLVVIDSPPESNRPIPAAPSGSDSETPTLDLDLWPWRITPDYREPVRRDVDMEMKLVQTVTADALAIWFSPQSVRRYVRSGNVRVGLSEDRELVVISVLKAPSQET